MPVVAILVIVFVLLVPGIATATVISYIYEFDTPQFEEPTFTALNEKLSALGPDITGRILLDTDLAIQVPHADVYRVSDGGAIHEGALDGASFDELPIAVWTLPDSLILGRIFHWVISDSDSGTDIMFEIDFAEASAAAYCVDWHGQDTCGFDSNGYPNRTYEQRVALSGFSLVDDVAVPEPPAIALMGLGLLGFVVARHKVRK